MSQRANVTGKPILFFSWAIEEGPDESYAHFLEQLAAQGFTDTQMAPLLSFEDDALLPEVVADIENASVIYFGGGDQNRLAAFFRRYPTLGTAVHAAYRQGVAVGGGSAGMMFMAEKMLTGKGPVNAIGTGLTELTAGLGLTVPFLFDSHFTERQRQNRLLSALLSSPENYALGIDGKAGIWLENDAKIRAYSDTGTYSSLFIRQGPRDFQLKLLANGDSVDLETFAHR